MCICKKLLLCTCIILLFSFTHVSAHSGRTDGRGGHHSGTGYHYHHGYPEHQHENGICPYQFDDRTDRSSRNNSGGSSTSSAKNQTPDTTTQEKQYGFEFFAIYFSFGLLVLMWFSLFAYSIFSATPLLTVFAIIVYYISVPIIISNNILPFFTYSARYFIVVGTLLVILNIRKWRIDFVEKQKRLQDKKMELYRESQKQLQEKIDRQNRELKRKEQQAEREKIVQQQKLMLIQKYSKPISQLCDIPDGIAVGSDGLPYEVGKSEWGGIIHSVSSTSRKSLSPEKL